MAATTVTRLGRFGPYLFIVPVTTAIGALASTLAGSVAVVAIGAVIGLGWGVLVGRIAGWLSQREDRDLKLANRSMLLAVLAATTLFGGSLFAMMLYSAASSAPEIVLFLMRPPMKGGFTFFLIFNTLMEWLVIPAAVYFNWHLSQRRILIVAGALLYYAARVWTYLYFVPNIFEFMATSTDGPLSQRACASVSPRIFVAKVCRLDACGRSHNRGSDCSYEARPVRASCNSTR